MKKVIYVASLLCLCACSNEFDTALEQQQEKQAANEIAATHRVDQEKALEQANLILEFPQTRSTTNLKVDYVIDKKATTRNICGNNDTVAYIFNWGEDDGFAIVAADDRVFPILAYSDKGAFKNEKGSLPEIYFTSKIGDYIQKETAQSAQTRGTIPDDFVGIPIYRKVERGPYMTSSWCWGQKEGTNDWAKYVHEKHPGAAIGCVAVATASIMVHCKDALYYHDTFLPLDRIREGTRNWQGSIDPSIEPLPREEAIDYAAKMLAWVGEDVHMDYGINESGAIRQYAYQLLKDLGFECTTVQEIPYDLDEAFNYFLSDHLLLVSGFGYTKETNKYVGHLWVADGYMYWNICGQSGGQLVTIGTTPLSIRFDWGAAGYYNGYYNGEVFFSGLATYDRNLALFPVKVENPESIFWDVYRPDDPNYNEDDDDDPFWGSGN